MDPHLSRTSWGLCHPVPHSFRPTRGAHSGVDGRKVDRSKVMRAFKQRDDKAVAELSPGCIGKIAGSPVSWSHLRVLDLKTVFLPVWTALCQDWSMQWKYAYVYINKYI